MNRRRSVCITIAGCVAFFAALTATRCLALDKDYEEARTVATEFRQWLENRVPVTLDDSPESVEATDAYWNRLKDYRTKLKGFGESGLKAIEDVGLAGACPTRKGAYWKVYTLIAAVDLPEVGRVRLTVFIRRSPLEVEEMASIISNYIPESANPAAWLADDAVFPLFKRLLDEKEFDSAKWGTMGIGSGDGTASIRLRGCDLAVFTIERWYAADLGWTVKDTPAAAAARDAAVEKAKSWIDERLTRFQVKEALFVLLEKRRELKVDEKSRLADACRLAASFAENRGDLARLVAVWLGEVDELARTGAQPDGPTKDFLGLLTGEVTTLFVKHGAAECKPPRGRDLLEAALARAWIANAVESCQKAEKTWHGRNEWDIFLKRLERTPAPAPPSR